MLGIFISHPSTSSAHLNLHYECGPRKRNWRFCLRRSWTSSRRPNLEWHRKVSIHKTMKKWWWICGKDFPYLKITKGDPRGSKAFSCANNCSDCSDLSPINQPSFFGLSDWNASVLGICSEHYWHWELIPQGFLEAIAQITFSRFNIHVNDGSLFGQFLKPRWGASYSRVYFSPSRLEVFHSYPFEWFSQPAIETTWYRTGALWACYALVVLGFVKLVRGQWLIPRMNG